jgi:hypothetical protein
MEKGYLKLRSLSSYSNLSIKTLRGMIQAGLPFFQKGKRGAILIKVTDFDDYMSRYRYGPDPQKIAEEMLT